MMMRTNLNILLNDYLPGYNVYDQSSAVILWLLYCFCLCLFSLKIYLIKTAIFHDVSFISSAKGGAMNWDFFY